MYTNFLKTLYGAIYWHKFRVIHFYLVFLFEFVYSNFRQIFDENLSRTNNLRDQISESITKNNSLIFTTINSSYVKQLINKGFKPDLTILDEAGQIFECATWPILFKVYNFFD